MKLEIFNIKETTDEYSGETAYTFDVCASEVPDLSISIFHDIVDMDWGHEWYNGMTYHGSIFSTYFINKSNDDLDEISEFILADLYDLIDTIQSNIVNVIKDSVNSDIWVLSDELKNDLLVI